MKRTCCVPGCTNTYPKTKLHRFPNPEKEMDRFKIWITSINQTDIENLSPISVCNYHMVCHSHFLLEDFSRNRRLFASAIPKMNLPDLQCRTSDDIDIQPIILSNSDVRPTASYNMDDEDMTSVLNKSRRTGRNQKVTCIQNSANDDVNVKMQLQRVKKQLYPANRRKHNLKKQFLMASQTSVVINNVKTK